MMLSSNQSINLPDDDYVAAGARAYDTYYNSKMHDNILSGSRVRVLSDQP